MLTSNNVPKIQLVDFYYDDITGETVYQYSFNIATYGHPGKYEFDVLIAELEHILKSRLSEK